MRRDVDLFKSYVLDCGNIYGGDLKDRRIGFDGTIRLNHVWSAYTISKEAVVKDAYML